MATVRVVLAPLFVMLPAFLALFRVVFAPRLALFLALFGIVLAPLMALGPALTGVLVRALALSARSGIGGEGLPSRRRKEREAKDKDVSVSG